MKKSTYHKIKSYLILINFLFSLLFLMPLNASEFELLANGEKVISGIKIKTENKLDIQMAKNEFEISTLILKNINKKDPLLHVDLVWDKKDPQVDLQTYWLGVHYFNKSSTRVNKASGEVADIPIPYELLKPQSEKIDIPEKNKPSKSQYLFEFYTGEKSIPGDYSGSILLKFKTKKIEVPVKLKIYNFKLPKAFNLKTSFGFAPWEVLKKHYGGWHKDEFKLYDLYFEEALNHRIDLHKIYVKYPDVEFKNPLTEGKHQEQTFKFQTEPLYNGEKSQYQFQMSITDLPVPDEMKNFKRQKVKNLKPIEEFWKKLNSAVKSGEYQNKTFVYFIDEPQTKDYKFLGEEIRLIRSWAPDLKFLVTTPFHKDLEGAINLWCINLFLWDRPTEKKPQFYIDRRLKQKEDFWFYVGCNSHGCDGPEEIENPDLIIDRASAYQRVFPWSALKYEASGLLYFDTVYGFTWHAGAPWFDQFHFTGYGEGALFYPCSKKFLNCDTNRVFSSLRLKILRDGLEDVEIIQQYLNQSSLINKNEFIKPVIKDVRDFSKNTIDYENLKRAALQKLAK